MTNFEHRPYSIGITFTNPAMVETYVRSWRERMLAWPWRPWVRTAVRPTMHARMIEMHERTQEDMRRTIGVDGL